MRMHRCPSARAGRCGSVRVRAGPGCRSARGTVALRPDAALPCCRRRTKGGRAAPSLTPSAIMNVSAAGAARASVAGSSPGWAETRRSPKTSTARGSVAPHPCGAIEPNPPVAHHACILRTRRG